uniref:Uncharacterized protein n=1 Tax=Arundo donax TaxID=35708 RepID=A0A0A8ZUC3_ARUDO
MIQPWEHALPLTGKEAKMK